MPVESVHPAPGERGPTFEALTESELEEKLARAARAFAAWSRRPVADRAAVVARAGQLFDDEADALGRLATDEMGKLVGAARDEARKCATACRYYAENAEAFMRPEAVVTSGDETGQTGEVRFDPL